MSRLRRIDSGFTLLEMAVVLVIIGLLMGGAMAGRSYVKNSELNSMIVEGKLYISAFTQFQERYNSVPGDFSEASQLWPAANGVAVAHNGDGNGLIRVGSTTNPLERFYAFEHLARAGMIEGSYTGNANNPSPGVFIPLPGVNIPRATLEGSALYFDHPAPLDGRVKDSNDGLYFDGSYQHVLIIAGIIPGATAMPNRPLLTPAQAFALDSKFDDGMPGAGWIMTPRSDAVSGCSGSGWSYALTLRAIGCYFILRVE